MSQVRTVYPNSCQIEMLSVSLKHINKNDGDCIVYRKEMFVLTMYSTHCIYAYIHSDSQRGIPLFGLLFPISSKSYFIFTIPQRGWHIQVLLLDQLLSTCWNEKSHSWPTMRDRFDDPSCMSGCSTTELWHWLHAI